MSKKGLCSYNHNKYSIFDIKEFIESRGFQTEYRYDKTKTVLSLWVVDHVVSVDIPQPLLYPTDDSKEKMYAFSAIRWHYTQLDKNDVAHNPTEKHVRWGDHATSGKKYEENKKLYDTLCRKFRKGRQEISMKKSDIKDYDKIKQITAKAQQNLYNARQKHKAHSKKFSWRTFLVILLVYLVIRLIMAVST